MTDTPDRLSLVMGLGRSGTTFLAKLIDSSPDVLYRHEPDAVLPTDLPTYPGHDQHEPNLAKARDYVRAMADCRHWRAASPMPIFSKSYRGALADPLYRSVVLAGKAARRWRFPYPRDVPDLTGRDRQRPHRVIKSVSSLGRAGLFRLALPDMAFVHIIRHPCAVAASLRVGIDKGVMGSNTYTDALFALEESGNYPFQFDEIAEATFEEQVAYRWMLLNDKAAADMAGASTYLSVVYEDLCTDVARVSRQVFDHLELDLGAQTQRFIDDISRPAEADPLTPGYFRVDRPVTSAVDKWRTQLTPEAIEKIRQIVSHSPLGRRFFDETPAPEATNVPTCPHPTRARIPQDPKARSSKASTTRCRGHAT